MPVAVGEVHLVEAHPALEAMVEVALVENLERIV
jgi:hypothetical protein